MAGTGPSAATATAHASIDLPAVPEEPSLERLKTDHAEYLRHYRKARLLQRENGFRDMQRRGAVRLAPARDVHERPVFVFTPSKLPESVDLDHVIMYGILLMHDTVFSKDKQYSCAPLPQCSLAAAHAAAMCTAAAGVAASAPGLRTCTSPPPRCLGVQQPRNKPARLPLVSAAVPHGAPRVQEEHACALDCASKHPLRWQSSQ